MQVQAGQVRVVFPEGVAVDTVGARRIILAVVTQPPFPGLPGGILDGRLITVSLAAVEREDRLAWASPQKAMIVLPVKKAFTWSESVLSQVIRHELAHLAFGAFWGVADSPAAWIEEGYAEWTSAGPPTCEAHHRMVLNAPILARGMLRADPVRTGIGRTHYDAYGSMWHFLYKENPSAIADGNFLVSVKEGGVDRGVRNVFGITFEELIHRWIAQLPMSTEEMPCPALL